MGVLGGRGRRGKEGGRGGSEAGVGVVGDVGWMPSICIRDFFYFRRIVGSLRILRLAMSNLPNHTCPCCPELSLTPLTYIPSDPIRYERCITKLAV